MKQDRATFERALARWEDNDVESAQAMLDKLLAIHPEHGDAHHLRGVIHCAAGQFDKAMMAFKCAAALQPENDQILANLGNAAHECGLETEAEAACRAALGLCSGNFLAWFNLGVVLHATHRYGQAAEAYGHACECDASDGDAWNNLAVALSLDGRADEALARIEEAVATVGPERRNLAKTLALILSDLGRHEEALPVYQHLHQGDAGDADVLGRLIDCKLRNVMWDGQKEDLDRFHGLLAGDPSLGFPFQYLSFPGVTPAQLRAIASRSAENWIGVRAGTLSAATGDPGGIRGSACPQRIGYLSYDFRDHVVARQCVGVLEAHDRRRFEIHAFSYGPDDSSDLRVRCMHAVDRFHDIQTLSTDQTVALIRSCEIDILVDLGGWSAHPRIDVLALRPAPLQVNWLGYAGTMGVPGLVDFIVGDPLVTPCEDARHFSECIARMPNCYLPNDRQRQLAPAPQRAAEGLPEAAFVFCSFNQTFKLNPAMFDIWCRLLVRIPKAILWLPEMPAPTRNRLLREAGTRAVAPERIVFAPRRSLYHEHLARLQLADLALDTFPYTSHATGSDILWAGVPLLTLRGETFASRVGASLLTSAGLPELIADSPEEFLELATRLAEEPELLAAFRNRLQENRLTCPLFDTERFSRELERLYERMWSERSFGESVQ